MSILDDQVSSSQQIADRNDLGKTITDFFKRILLSENFVLYLSITYFIIMAIFFPSLAQPRNISNQLSNVWPLLAVTVGQTFVLIIAGIDLSQGSIMAVVSVAGGFIMTTAVNPALFEHSPLWGSILHEDGGLLAGHSLAVPAAVAVMLLVGSLVGLLNGIAITRFNMPPFMVTLVSLIFFSSFAIFLTQSQNISNLPDEFLKLGEGDIVSVYFGEKAEPEIRRRDILPFVTYPMVISLGLAVAGQFILRRTVLGRHIYAIGTNLKAAEISGVPTKRVIMLVFMFSGFCAAVASILYSARLQGGRPTIGGGNLLLDIIAATVIGGTSLYGGKGKVTWTFFGVVFFVLLLSGGNQQKVVIAKWLLSRPSIFIMDEPTRGVDVGAKYEIYTIINDLAAQGAGILFISSELEELMGMCDRILVMNQGEIITEFEQSAFDKEQILRSAFREGNEPS